MERPKICLTLTGKTLAQNVELVKKYRQYIDIAELRVDHLDPNEWDSVRQFPHMVDLPCILTIRRKVDGGEFIDGEVSRTILFARALAFADTDQSKNFKYIDFEEDFHIPSLQDAALAFGIKIIRSYHDMKNPVVHLKERLDSLKTTGYEIPKIAFTPHSLDDVTRLFKEAEKLEDSNHILVAMGDFGIPSRILSAKLNNYLTYCSAKETSGNVANLGHLDPVTLNEVYHFRNINSETKVFGITGWPLDSSSSPALHNPAFVRHGMNSVYVPVRAEKVEQALNFANTIDMKGLSVTVPHKEKVMAFAMTHDPLVESIGACNTIVREGTEWHAYNTDAPGFAKALLEFTGLKSLRGKRVSIIGAGGAARAIAHVVKDLHGKACVFNRTVSKARELAELYGFKYATLGFDSAPILKKYSQIIIQTTSKGMHKSPPSTDENDPLYFYNFTGKETLLDIIYIPSSTPVMVRASQAGCKVCNGYDMLKYQGFEQFKLFTGEDY